VLIKRTERMARRPQRAAFDIPEKHAIERRTFLRRSGLAAGGFAALGSLPLGGVRQAKAGPPPAAGAQVERRKTICTHCADGCKTTLGVRNNEIIRGNNRDQSGINGEFLCIKGRYAFDFVHHVERLQSPMLRKNGELQPVSWSEALTAASAAWKPIFE